MYLTFCLVFCLRFLFHIWIIHIFIASISHHKPVQNKCLHNKHIAAPAKNKGKGKDDMIKNAQRFPPRSLNAEAVFEHYFAGCSKIIIIITRRQTVALRCTHLIYAPQHNMLYCEWFNLAWLRRRATELAPLSHRRIYEWGIDAQTAEVSKLPGTFYSR